MHWYQFITWPNWLIFLGGTIAAIGALSSSVTDKQEASRFETQLNAKNETIEELQKSLADQLTGGSGHCVCPISPPELSHESKWMLAVMNASDLAQFDVTVSICDLSAAEAEHKRIIEAGGLGHMTTEDIRALDDVMTPFFSKTFPMLPRHEMIRMVAPLELPADNTRQSYSIRIVQRNGTVEEVVRFVKVGDRWTCAIKVFWNNALESVKVPEGMTEEQFAPW